MRLLAVVALAAVAALSATVVAEIKAPPYTITTVGSAPLSDANDAIAFGPNNEPYFAYKDSQDKAPILVRCRDVDCNTVANQAIGTHTNVGHTNVELEVTSDGRAVLTYTLGPTLQIAICNDLDCSLPDIRELTETGDRDALRLDSNDVPVVAYLAGDWDLYFLRCNSPTCTNVDVQPVDTQGYQGMFIDMVLDSNDLPRISYADYGNGIVKLAVCTDIYCSSSVKRELYTFGAWVWVDISIAIADDDRPLVVWGAAGRVTIGICTDPTCTDFVERSLYSAAAGAFFVHVAAGPFNAPTAVFHDNSDNTLRMAVCSDKFCNDFEVFTIDDQVRVGQHAIIDIDSNGNPAVPYRDYDTGLLKYVHLELFNPNITYTTPVATTTALGSSDPWACTTISVTGRIGYNTIINGEYQIFPKPAEFNSLPIWMNTNGQSVYLYSYSYSASDSYWFFSGSVGDTSVYAYVYVGADQLTGPYQEGSFDFWDGSQWAADANVVIRCAARRCESCPQCSCSQSDTYCNTDLPCTETSYDGSLYMSGNPMLKTINSDTLRDVDVGRDLYIRDNDDLVNITTGAFSSVHVDGWMYISGNNLQTIQPYAFGGFTVTRDFVLDYDGSLSKLATHSLAGATIGASFRLENNPKLAVIEARAFERTTVGKFFSIGLNAELKRISTDAFSGVSIGTFITINNHAQLTDIEPHAFRKCRVGSTFFFNDNNEITTLRTHSFSGVSVEGSLEIVRNKKLNRIEPHAFAGSLIQTHLKLHGSPLGIIEPEALGGVVTKGSIELSQSNSLTVIPARCFKGTQAGVIMIQNNKELSDISPDAFQGLDIKWDIVIGGNDKLKRLRAGTFRGLTLNTLFIYSNHALEMLEDGVFNGLTVSSIQIIDNPRLRTLSPGVFSNVLGNPTVTLMSGTLQCCDLEWLVRGDVVQLSDESRLACNWPSSMSGINILDPANGYTDPLNPKTICPCAANTALKPQPSDGQQGASPACVQTCGDGFHRRTHYNASGSVCDVCTIHHDMDISERPDPNCLACKAGDNPHNMFDASTCQRCGNGKFLMDGQGCVDSCDVNIFGDRIFGFRTVAFNASQSVGRECERCASTGCMKCDEARDKCTMCGNNMLLLDGRCVDSCPSLLRSGRAVDSEDPDDYVFRYEARGGQQDAQTGVWIGRSCVSTVEQQVFTATFVDDGEELLPNATGRVFIGKNGTLTVHTVLGASMSDVGLSEVHSDFNVSGGVLERFSAVDFPCGLTVAASSGELVGSPQLAGVYNVSVLAFSTQGDSAFVANGVTSIVVEDCDDELSCNGGKCVDDIPFDNDFVCDCSGTDFAGSDCTVIVDPQASNSANNTTMYAASGVAAFVVVCALLLVLIVVVRSRRRYRDQMRKIEEVKDRANARFRSGDLSALESLAEQHMSTLEVPRSSVGLGEEIGKGEFGVVHVGQIEAGSGRSSKRSRVSQVADRVAIKQLHNDAAMDAVESFYFEAKLMCVLTHPNIVSILAVCTTTPPFMVCLEYMENGDLRNYLKKNKQQLIIDNAHEDGLLVGVIHQVASAMQHLYFNNIVHRDLAARNVLVGKSLRVVKLADFGMSKNLDESEYYRKTDNEKVPLKWMAPEAIRDKKYSHASDVWSFGVLCWEVFSYGAMPYAHYSPTELIMHVGTGHHLQRPEYCSKDVFTHIKPMWRMDASQRPTFSDLASVFGDLQEQFSDAAIVARKSVTSSASDDPTARGSSGYNNGSTARAKDYVHPASIHEVDALDKGAMASSAIAAWDEPDAAATYHTLLMEEDVGSKKPASKLSPSPDGAIASGTDELSKPGRKVSQKAPNSYVDLEAVSAAAKAQGVQESSFTASSGTPESDSYCDVDQSEPTETFGFQSLQASQTSASAPSAPDRGGDEETIDGFGYLRVDDLPTTSSDE